MENADSKKVLSAKYLNEIRVYGVLSDDMVKDMFINVYMANHQTSHSEAEAFYANTTKQLRQIVKDTEYLQPALGDSVYNCLLDIASWGLPISAGSQQLIYVIGGNVKRGDQKYRVMTVQQTVDGKEASSIKAGNLMRSEDVTLVRDGDVFSIVVNEHGNKSVVYNGDPKNTNPIIGGFIKFIFPDRSWEYIYNPYPEIERLAEYSKKKNFGRTNELYTSGTNGQGDVGFIKTKFKSLALKTLPKLAMAQYSFVSNADYEEGYNAHARGLEHEDFNLADVAPEAAAANQEPKPINGHQHHTPEQPEAPAQPSQPEGVTIPQAEEEEEELF